MQIKHDTSRSSWQMFRPLFKRVVIIILFMGLVIHFALFIYDYSIYLKKKEAATNMLKWWLDIYYQEHHSYPASLIWLESEHIISPIWPIITDKWKEMFSYKLSWTWYLLD